MVGVKRGNEFESWHRDMKEQKAIVSVASCPLSGMTSIQGITPSRLFWLLRWHLLVPFSTPLFPLLAQFLLFC